MKLIIHDGQTNESYVELCDQRSAHFKSSFGIIKQQGHCLSLTKGSAK
jgi:hypothetical protein